MGVNTVSLRLRHNNHDFQYILGERGAPRTGRDAAKNAVWKLDIPARFPTEPMVMLAPATSISAYGSLRRKPEKGSFFTLQRRCTKGETEA